MTMQLFSKVCQRGGDIIVPLFETPFFAHGAGAECVVANSRSTCAYVGPDAGGGASGFYYRPDVTVLNVTPNRINVYNSGLGPGAICLQGNIMAQIFRLGGSPFTSIRAYQQDPFGTNLNNPIVSNAPPNGQFDPLHSSTMELRAAGGAVNGLFIAMSNDEGILTGNLFYCFNPIFPSLEHFAQGPAYNGVGEAARYMDLNNSIVSPTDDNNYFICGGLPSGGPPCNVVRWGNLPNGDLHGTRWAMSFDDPGIDAQLNGASSLPRSIRTTRAGWIVSSLAQVTASMKYDVILIAKTGDTWRRIIFAPQTPRASNAINNVSLFGQYAMHIDNSGILYLFDYTDDGRLYTSFGLDIPLIAPLIPANQMPNLPCMPLCFPLGLDVPAL